MKDERKITLEQASEMKRQKGWGSTKDDKVWDV
jgi:hypothetical protein